MKRISRVSTALCPASDRITGSHILFTCDRVRSGRSGTSRPSTYFDNVTGSFDEVLT